MNIVDTKFQCRCPTCRNLVPRVVDKRNSRILADCPRCSYQPIPDIHQPAPKRMNRGSVIAMASQKPDMPLASRAVAAVRALKKELGKPMKEVSVLLGYSEAGVPVNLTSYKHGKLGDRAAVRMLNAVKEYRQTHHTAGASQALL